MKSMQDVQELIDQINANSYLKCSLINPLINQSKGNLTENEAMDILASYPFPILKLKIDSMLSEINEAIEKNDTDALYRLENNLFFVDGENVGPKLFYGY